MNPTYLKNKAQIYQWRCDNKNAYNDYQRKLVAKRYAASHENDWSRIVRAFRKLGPELFQ
jgi:hypothetical protein